MTPTALQSTWYVLIVVLFAGYAILDGFDLGVGILHPFCRDGKTRRAHIAAIAPFWDGNEVWLLTAGGALFAAFPPVYACVFSGFYVAIMALVWCLILRAIGIEFRGKVDSARWRAACDWAFFAGSAGATFLLGVTLGNILRGLPLDENGDYTGWFLDLLNFPSLLMGVFSLVWAALHGALYVAMRTEGDVRDAACKKARVLSWVLWLGFLCLANPGVPSYLRLMDNFFGISNWWVAGLLSSVGIPIYWFTREKAHVSAFLVSSLGIACFLFCATAMVFPNFVVASNDLWVSLTAANASSSPKTLFVMLVIALIGFPIVLAYTACIHYAFRGKVKAEGEEY